MTPIEKWNIDSLPQKEYNSLKNIEKLSSEAELRNAINNRLFRDLENGQAMIERHNGEIIFKQKDINSVSLIERKGTKFEGHAFRVNENRLNKYLEKEQQKENLDTEQKALLDKLVATLESKGKLNKLKEEVILSEDAQKLMDKINTIEDRLKDSKDRPRSPKFNESKNSKKRYKQIIKDDLSLIKSIKKELKSYSYDTNIDYFVDIVNTIQSHKHGLEKVRQIIATGGNTSEIPSILNSIKDVKKEELFQNIAASYNIEYNSISQNATMKKLRNEDMEAFQDYLKQVWSGEIEHPEKDKFYIKHKKDFEYLMMQNPALYTKILSNRREQRNVNPENNRYYSTTYVRKYKEQTQRCASGKGAFEQGGEWFSDALVSVGLIDEHDTKKREAWKNFGRIGLIIGGVVLGFKIIKKLFSKDKDKRLWIGGGVAGLFALKNIDGIKGWFKDAFGSSNPSTEQIKQSTGVENNETFNEIVDPGITTMATLGGIPINTLIQQGLLIEQNGKIKMDYKKYETYVKDSNLDKDEQKRLLENMQKIKENESLLEDGLKYFGIEKIDDLQKISGNDNKKTLLDSDKMANYFESISSGVNADISKEGLKPKDPKAWYEITQEYKDPNNDAQIIDWIKRGLLISKNDGLIKPYKLQEIIKNPNIDLENKKIKGLDIKFDNYSDLFGATALTSFIKENFGNRAAKSYSPFHVSTTGNIQFDDQDRFDMIGDTDVVNSNDYKNTLDRLSPTLNNNKDTYVNYLNTRWNATGAVEK